MAVPRCSPAWALFQRDFVRVLRRPATFLLFTATTGLVFYYFLRTIYDFHSFQSAEYLFQSLTRSVYLATLLLLPFIGASSITAEREHDTLDMLWMADFSPGAIIWSKLAATFSLFIMLLIAYLPLFGIVFFFTGVGPFQLASALVGLTSTAFAVSALSVMCSARSQRTIAAIVLTYALLLLFAYFCGILVYNFVNAPILLLFQLMSTTVVGLGAAKEGTDNLRRLPPSAWVPPKERGRGGIDVVIVPAYPTQKLRDDRNPVFSRELAAPRLMETSVAAAILLFAINLLLISFESNFRRTESELFLRCLVAPALSLFILLPMFLGSTFAREREAGIMEDLLVTDLGCNEVWKGKLRAALFLLCPPLLGTLAILPVLSLFDAAILPAALPKLPLGLLQFGATISLGFGLTALVAVNVRTQMQGLFLSGLTLLGVTLGLPLIISALAEVVLSFDSVVSAGAARAAQLRDVEHTLRVLSSPILAQIEAMEKVRHGSSAFFAIIALLQLATGIALTAYAARRFRRLAFAN